MSYPDDELLRDNLDPQSCEQPPGWADTFRWFHQYPQRWDPANFINTLDRYIAAGWPEHRTCGPQCYYRDVAIVAVLAVSLSSSLNRDGIANDRTRALLVIQAIELVDLGHHGASATLAALRYDIETTTGTERTPGRDPLDDIEPFASTSHGGPVTKENSALWQRLNDEDLPEFPGR